MLEGKKAPNFTLKDKDGVAHSLSDITAKHICLFFYPKDNTPGCTIEAKEFTAQHTQFKKTDCAVIGISGGDEKSKAKFCEKNDLDVLLLSDSDFKTSKAYKSYGEKQFMGRTYNGIFRKTFILGADRTVVKVFDEVKPEGHASEVLEFLAGKKSAQSAARAKKPAAKKAAPKKSAAKKAAAPKTAAAKRAAKR